MKKKIWNYSGEFLLITGIVHCLFGLYFGWNILLEICNEKVINSILSDETIKSALNIYFLNALEGTKDVIDLQRFGLFWFLFTGFFWIGVGPICKKQIKIQNRPLPIYFGWFLLAYSGIGCFILPISGFWILVPQALIIIIANRNLKVIA